jgi:hypothetical protein
MTTVGGITGKSIIGSNDRTLASEAKEPRRTHTWDAPQVCLEVYRGKAHNLCAFAPQL